MVFYQDREIEISPKDVLLSGGYSGHANFGDVAQLKSVISWYKKRDSEVIVVIRLDSIYDKAFISKLYEWFDVKGFIFYSPTILDVSKYDLFISKEFMCTNFHLYGGGMINTFWAKYIIDLTQSIIERFQVKDYVISGQQIDTFGAKLLVEHFKEYHPSIVGVRDRESFNNLEEHNLNVVFSFDDAYEELNILKESFNVQESLKQEIYLHFNLSPYVSENLHEFIDNITNSLSIIKKKYPNARYKLLLTYLDSRILSIVDTLGVIGTLDYHFDMDEVTIINLASISLKSKAKSKINIASNSIVLATSYHTAMFMQLLGLKVYMFAGNEYYEQKRAGLELESVSLDNVLEDDISKYVDEDKRQQSRAVWLGKLAKAVNSNLIEQKRSFNAVYPVAQVPFKRKQIQTNLDSTMLQVQANSKITNKVYGIGWAKTGTTTLGEALKILRYKHKTQDFTLVSDILNGEYKNIKQELARYDSFDDWPWIILYKQLDALSENSKFILTLRDEESWLKSYRNMLQSEGIPSEATNKIRSYLYGLHFPNVSDKELLARYRQHNEDVKNYFKYRPNDLLIVNWFEDNSWEKICNFLKKDIPKNDFPHKNRGLYDAVSKISKEQ